MTIEEAIRKTLIADAGVAALIQTRVYADQAIEDTEFPCAVFSSPDAVPDEASYTLAGPGLKRTTIVLSGLGRTWAEARAVADAIYAALGPYQGQRSFNGVPIEGLHFERMQNVPPDPDSQIHQFDRVMEIIQQ